MILLQGSWDTVSFDWCRIDDQCGRSDTRRHYPRKKEGRKKKNRDKEQGQISPLNLKKKIGNEETNSYSHGGGVVVDDCQCQ